MYVAGRNDAIGTERIGRHAPVHRYARFASDVSVGAVRDRAGRRSSARYPRQAAGPRIVVDSPARYSGSGLRRQRVCQGRAWPSGCRRRAVGPGRGPASRSVYRGDRHGAPGRPGGRGLREGPWISSERQGGRGLDRLRCRVGWTVQDHRAGIRRDNRGYVVRFGARPSVRAHARGACRDRIARIGRATGFRGESTRGLQNADRIGKVELR